MVKTSAMREADLQYLRNINTKPGPDAGRSIDPTKPGPDDRAEATRADTKMLDALTSMSQSGGVPQPDAKPFSKRHRSDLSVDQAAIAQSDAEPVAWQIRTKLTQGNWTFWLGDGKPELNEKVYEVRPLYTSPTR